MDEYDIRYLFNKVLGRPINISAYRKTRSWTRKRTRQRPCNK